MDQYCSADDMISEEYRTDEIIEDSEEEDEDTQKPASEEVHTHPYANFTIDNQPSSGNLVMRVKKKAGRPSSVNYSLEKNLENRCIIPEEEIDLSCSHVLGSGAFGTVYKARLWDLDVAVKEVQIRDTTNDGEIMALSREISLLRSLSHPNIVAFRGFSYSAGGNKLKILCEYLDQGSLLDLLQNPRIRIDKKIILDIAISVALGMRYLHDHHPPVYHKDLKSSNVLVGDNWRSIKVSDFGLSDCHIGEISRGGVGAVQWRAPEATPTHFTKSSDVFSYGVLLWELITRKTPFRVGCPYIQIRRAILSGMRPDLPAHCPPKFKNLIRRCWDKNPNNRPAFQEILEILQKLYIEDDEIIITKRGFQVLSNEFIKTVNINDENKNELNKSLNKENSGKEINNKSNMNKSNDKALVKGSKIGSKIGNTAFVTPTRLLRLDSEALYRSLPPWTTLGRVSKAVIFKDKWNEAIEIYKENIADVLKCNGLCVLLGDSKGWNKILEVFNLPTGDFGDICQRANADAYNADLNEESLAVDANKQHPLTISGNDELLVYKDLEKENEWGKRLSGCLAVPFHIQMCESVYFSREMVMKEMLAPKTSSAAISLPLSPNTNANSKSGNSSSSSSSSSSLPSSSSTNKPRSGSSVIVDETESKFTGFEAALVVEIAFLAGKNTSAFNVFRTETLPQLLKFPQWKLTMSLTRYNEGQSFLISVFDNYDAMM